MKIEKFNEGSDESKKQYPYELTDNGELIKTNEFNAKKLKCVYLTDDEYNKLKGLSNSTKNMCELLDEKKKAYLDILRAAISKVKNEDK